MQWALQDKRKEEENILIYIMFAYAQKERVDTQAATPVLEEPMKQETTTKAVYPLQNKRPEN
jgi:hypothetical protein